jgi:hypothetical protein
MLGISYNLRVTHSPQVLFTVPWKRPIMASESTQPSLTLSKDTTPMSHDLIFALVFLIMIAAPALITTTPDRDERDPL